MTMNRLSSDFWVSPQITARDVQTIADHGIRSIICNRPDNESFGQPAASEIETAARALGLHFAFVPAAAAGLSMQDVLALRTALDEVPGPTLLYCRSGTRSVMLWALAMAGRMAPDAIIAAAAESGFNVSRLRPAIEGLATQFESVAGG